MDTIKTMLNNVRNFIFGMRTEQKMKFAASLLMLVGGGALALAAAQDDDEMIDISEVAEVLDDESTDISEPEVSVESSDE